MKFDKACGWAPGSRSWMEKPSENPAGTLAFLEKISQQIVHVKDIDVPSRMCLCNLIILLGI